MTEREELHEADRKALRALDRRPVFIIALAIALIIASTGVVFGVTNAHATDQVRHATEQVRTLTAQAQAAADTARKQALAGCQAYKLIADAPPAASDFGVSISAAMRIAYATAQCQLGPLSPPDPRVAALLPPGVK